MATGCRRCMISNCGKTSKDKYLSFHSFPKRKDICDLWVSNIKQGQPDWTVPKFSSSKYYAICSRHFELGCFKTVKRKFDLASRNTLKPEAVPTLFMDGSSPSMLHSGILDGFPTNHEMNTAEAATALPPENGNAVINSDGGEDQKPSLEMLNNTNVPGFAPDMYSPAGSGNSPSMNASVDEKSPKKYVLASRRCMVFGCDSTSRNRRLSFHAFPKNPELKEEWLARIKINRPNWSVKWPESNYYAVCSRHFTPECFKTTKHDLCSTSRNTLKPDAIPSLYLSGEHDPSYPHMSAMDYSNQDQIGQQFLINGMNTSASFQQSIHSQTFGENNGQTMLPTNLESCLRGLHQANGSWSHGESAMTDVTTQTVPETSEEVKPKLTRTVRVQTMITIKKSVESKETQYDLPNVSKCQCTHHEHCTLQSQPLSS